MAGHKAGIGLILPAGFHTQYNPLEMVTGDPLAAGRPFRLSRKEDQGHFFVSWLRT